MGSLSSHSGPQQSIEKQATCFALRRFKYQVMWRDVSTVSFFKGIDGGCNQVVEDADSSLSGLKKDSKEPAERSTSSSARPLHQFLSGSSVSFSMTHWPKSTSIPTNREPQELPNESIQIALRPSEQECINELYFPWSVYRDAANKSEGPPLTRQIIRSVSKYATQAGGAKTKASTVLI